MTFWDFWNQHPFWGLVTMMLGWSSIIYVVHEISLTAVAFRHITSMKEGRNIQEKFETDSSTHT